MNTGVVALITSPSFRARLLRSAPLRLAYAGAVGEMALEDLRLGRAFPIGLVEDLLRRGEQGSNPFPPTF
jgi:hypothetical protein